MRYSKLFGKTVRNTSQSIISRGHEYLFKAGFLRESSAGRFYMLPLGMRVQDKICRVIEEEMDRVDAQKMSAPTLHPLELWQETNRTESASFELMQVCDRNQRKFVLGGTAEEMMVDLVRKFDLSLRDLPFCIYQFSQKFRDELRVRAGLLRCREFLMKDAYSFHATKEDFESYYEKMKQAYKNIFTRLGLKTLIVESDNGYMGGEYCHELVVEHELGETRFLVNDEGTYAAHEEVACFLREQMNETEELLALEVKAAKRGISVQAGVEFYSQPAWRQIKSIIYVTDKNETVLVSVRGDLEINETKLIHVLGCRLIRFATEEEVKALGSVIGFVSPLKLKVKKVGDISLKTVRNFSTGADQWELDTLNVNYGRDFTCDILADVAMAQDGHRTLNGKQTLHERRGIEVGNIFQLGTWYSERMQGANFTSEDGKKHNFFMGCYGLGVGRTLAAIAEIYNDEHGLRWTKESTPFDVHLISLAKEQSEIDAANALYEELSKAGISVLFDDRNASAGIKFNDADLIGIEHRLLVSKKTIEAGGVEYKKRGEKQAEIINAPLAHIKACLLKA